MDIRVLCSSRDTGAALRKFCDIGCLGCRLCEKNCPSGAIWVNDNLAVIDYDKCTNCSQCVSKCPRKLLMDINGIPEVRANSLSS